MRPEYNRVGNKKADSRSPTITGTSPRASVSDNNVWEFDVSPRSEAYCRATPTEWLPFVGKAVSFTTRTASSPPVALRPKRLPR